MKFKVEVEVEVHSIEDLGNINYQEEPKEIFYALSCGATSGELHNEDNEVVGKWSLE